MPPERPTAFSGEIHYTRIGGTKDSRFQTAQDWLATYFRTALPHCPFKAFIVEQEGIRSFPYPGDAEYPAHAAHALLSSFVGGIAWSYSKATSIALRPVFDGTDNEVDLAIYRDLPAALSSTITEKRLSGGASYPFVSSQATEFVSSNPLQSEELWGDAELVQLTDLLLGAAVDTLEASGRSPKTGRLKLSRSVAQVLAETLAVPWFQQVPVHRRFSVSLYPDEFNLAYPAALLKVARDPVVAGPRLPGFDLTH